MKRCIKKVLAKLLLLYQSAYKNFYSLWSVCGNIWMFHLVTNEDEINYERDFTIRKDNFISLVETAKKNGFHFRSMDDLATATTNDIFLTFDDGFKEVYSVVYPLLRQYNIPFCVFVTVEFIDKTGYLSEKELIELSEDNLCVIGAHTITHPRLKELEKNVAIMEIQQSKLRLEKILKKPVEYFAYPYGDFFSVSKRNRKIVKKCGFRYAFSTIQMPLNRSVIKKSVFIPRNNVNDDNYEQMIYRSGD